MIILMLMFMFMEDLEGIVCLYKGNVCDVGRGKSAVVPMTIERSMLQRVYSRTSVTSFFTCPCNLPASSRHENASVAVLCLRGAKVR